MSGKPDLRVVRTRKSIKEAFLKLVKEKGYEKITVQNIADEAFINRNTFYLHYLDKEDLMEKLSIECLDELEFSLSTNPNFLNEESIKPLIRSVLQTIYNNQTFYQIMLNDSGSSLFTEKLKVIIKDNMRKYMFNKPHQEFCFEYIVSGFIGVICFILNNSASYSIDDTSNLIFKLLFDNVLSLLV